MSNYRYGGQVIPNIPPTAPLELRLPAEVYALDGCCPGRASTLGNEAPYVLPYPGGRLEVGPHGRLYESMGAYSTTSKFLIAAAVIGGALWFMKK